MFQVIHYRQGRDAARFLHQQKDPKLKPDLYPHRRDEYISVSIRGRISDRVIRHLARHVVRLLEMKGTQTPQAIVRLSSK